MEMLAVEASLDAMSGGELLDHAGDLAALQRRCEVEMLRVAVQHAYLSDPDVLDPAEACRPGRERARRLGGPGTPVVREFAAAELAGRLGCSTVSAGLLMADGLDICHRLPRLWAGVQDGSVRVYLARLVARRTRELDAVQADYVDERVSEYADGRLSYTRFERLVEAAVTAADVEAARVREEQAAQAQWARPTRPEQGESDHGMRGFTIRADFGTVKILDATLARLAAILADLGDTDPVDQRRVKALLILCRPDVAADLIAQYTVWRDRPDDPPETPAQEPGVSTSSTTETPERSPSVEEVALRPSRDHRRPDRSGDRSGGRPPLTWSDLLPHVVVHVHAYAGPDADQITRVEECGAMTTRWVARHLTKAATVTVRPVLDIEGLAPVDAYEIPDRHRRAVQLMTPADTFPYAASLRPDQIDHTEPFVHGPAAAGAGQSRIGNYGPLRTFHHRIKTFGKWTVKQPFPGIYLWQDPHGHHYLVDHTGTRALARARAA